MFFGYCISEYGGVYKIGGGGRVQNIYYLLKKGALFISENLGIELEDIQYPKNIDGIFRNDYFHRISTVNSQISFEQWAKRLDYTVLFFHTYFHKVGSAKGTKDNNPLKSITRIEIDETTFIEPDAIFLYRTKERLQLMVLEVHNGKDVTRLVNQLKLISFAVSKGLFTSKYKKQYGLETVPRILVTLESDNMIRLVQKRMNEDKFFNVIWMSKAFLFKVDTKTWGNFHKDWQNKNGESVDLSKL